MAKSSGYGLIDALANKGKSKKSSSSFDISSLLGGTDGFKGGGGSHSFDASGFKGGGGSASFGTDRYFKGGGASHSFDNAPAKSSVNMNAVDKIADKYALSKEASNSLSKGIKYNSSSTSSTKTYDFLPEVRSMLKKAGTAVKDLSSKVYDSAMESAVKVFQKDNGLKNNGILDEGTLNAIADKANENAPDNIETLDPMGDEDDKNIDPNKDNPHYSSYFDEDKDKTFRQNINDIKIVLGQGSITKTIKDVYMRSQTIEFDTSGNPISEVYEFIARDITESDEKTDEGKYDGEENYAPSDIKYIFNYK